MKQITQLFVVAFVIVMATSCSSWPKRVEELRPDRRTHLFWIQQEEGVDIATSCRLVDDETAEVGISLKNNGWLDELIGPTVELLVDGKVVESIEVAGVTLKRGDSWEQNFKYSFSVENPRGRKRVEVPRRLIQVRIGDLKSPAVILDLSHDNRVPFRFLVTED